MNLLGKAISIAAKAFENKVDKGGKPYILHCLWVMNNVRHLGEDAMICAVLHMIGNTPVHKRCIAIKLKDLEHNMKPNRLKGLTKEDHDRMDKYMRWYTYLSKI